MTCSSGCILPPDHPGSCLTQEAWDAEVAGLKAKNTTVVDVSAVAKIRLLVDICDGDRVYVWGERPGSDDMLIATIAVNPPRAGQLEVAV
jgi:hypothetical protein